MIEEVRREQAEQRGVCGEVGVVGRRMVALQERQEQRRRQQGRQQVERAERQQRARLGRIAGQRAVQPRAERTHDVQPREGGQLVVPLGPAPRAIALRLAEVERLVHVRLRRQAREEGVHQGQHGGVGREQGAAQDRHFFPLHRLHMKKMHKY
eukprot:scaffold21106_cov101-Isochrysis_galbana.AAC.1